MRVLGIDYGDRHIGLAMTDALKLTALPFGTYKLKASESENRKYFQDLVIRYSIDEIVIGFPLRMDGTQGTRTRITKEFAGWLEKAVHRPVNFMDERLTTQQALHYVEDLKVRGKKKKECEDQISAVIILSAYLERKRGDSDAPQDR